MSKRPLAILLTAAAAAGTLAASALPAQAASGYGRCPSGHYCLFSGPNGTGEVATFRFGSPDLRQQGMDNDAESEWNRSGRTALYHTAYDYTGENWLSVAGRQGPLADGWANIPSSVQVG